MVRRIFVEKKEGFDIEAQRLSSDLRLHLHLQQVKSVRVVNRYDIEGLEKAVYESAKYTVFSEPAIDRVWEEAMDLGADSFYFAVEYLPGQYDQRADSAAQCIQMLNTSAKTLVRSAKIYVITGKLNETEQEAVKKYCINPVDSREANWEKPMRLEMDMEAPEDVESITDFLSWEKEELETFRKNGGFAMSKEDMHFVQEYYKKEDRLPTITELRVIDTYWSDHCRHTTFNTKIMDVQFDEDTYGGMIKEAYSQYKKIREEVYGEREKNVCLMDMAVIGAKYLKQQGLAEDLDESEEINACSIKVKAVIDGKEEDWLVMFKNETHNHPTEIEPFGGAATCLGGAIRDPLSGRVYVYQAMRVSGSGDPRTKMEETLSGKLPQRKITKGAADGYSSYGNQIGLATGQVTEIYDSGYVAKRMEVGAVIGAAPAAQVRRERPVPGDCIVLVGGKTGRDGCGGATGSSKEHTEESILNCGAEVQKGNPPVERSIQRFYRRKEVAELIKRCNDFGAGGVSVAIGELADSLDVNLDLVPKKYEGLDGTELAISESQERMAAVISREDCEAFISYANAENLEATVVASVTDTGYFRMFWRGKCILNLSRAFLDTNGVTQQVAVKVKTPSVPIFENRKPGTMREAAADLNCCSQKGLTEQFDSTIGAGSVLMPLGGKYQLSPAAGMAAKLPLTEGYTDTATLMSFGFDPQISKNSPFHGALYAVVDSVTKLVAMGGDYSKARLTFQEYFERLGENPEKWGKPFSALLGALKAQLQLEIPAIGGKDSMSGTFMDIHVPPTLISFAVTAVDAENVISSEFKKAGSHLVWVYADRDQEEILDFEQYKNNMKRVQQLVEEKKILAALNVGHGGLFSSALKMAAGNKIGVHLEEVTQEELYQSAYGSLLLEVSENENIAELFTGSQYKTVGRTTEASEFVISFQNEAANTEKEDLEKLISAWQAPLEEIFPTQAKTVLGEKEEKAFSYQERNQRKPKISHAKPRVFIPVFPGTNCEMDSKRAFERAGAIGEIQIIRNRSEQDLNESIEEMAKKIKNSQMIMIPGGFSGGDEPDGSAKFITALFRNPMIHEAVAELMEERDGLMLGICNGFQALIKLGLVPYGKITPATEESPTLTYNRIGRHVSCLTRTRVASVKSPWLALTEVGDVHTIPISHGEGRFIADASLIEALAKNGQIATQYVDLNDVPTMDPRWNPNGSAAAVCGITSPDGRIFGKMGHSERIGNNLYKNVDGETDQKLFEAGVNYFIK